jgi:hypothetical protein
MAIFEDYYADDNINDIDDAMELIKELWDKVNPDCIFSDEEPTDSDPESVTLPHIVYDTLHRAHTDKLSDGRKPRKITDYPDPDQPGHNLTEAIEWFDCIVEFVIYDNTRRGAKNWMKTFERFILTYTGYLKKRGIHEIVFLQEGDNEVSTRNRTELPHRRLQYLVRIQRSLVLRSIRLDEVTFETRIMRPDGTKSSEIYPSTEGDEFLRLYNQKVK